MPVQACLCWVCVLVSSAGVRECEGAGVLLPGCDQCPARQVWEGRALGAIVRRHPRLWCVTANKLSAARVRALTLVETLTARCCGRGAHVCWHCAPR